FGKDASKIKVLIFAQQHGDEQSGKEGALLLINELLKTENQYLFDKIDFTLVPQLNPDGSEKDQRRNGNEMDLNRNHLILTEPEVIGLHQLFNKYLFEVTMDVHEYWPFSESSKKFGYHKNYDETIGAMTNINISEKLRKLSYDKYIPFIFDYISKKNFSAFHYLPGGSSGSENLRYSTFDINDGRQSFGIQNTLSFIQEGLNGENSSLENIEHRAKGQMIGMLGLLKFSYDNIDEIKKLVVDERKNLEENKADKQTVIQLNHFSDGTELKLNLRSYSTGSDTVVTVKDFRSVVKSLYDVERPKGYLIPKDLKEVIDWAERHELKYYDYQKTSDDKIEQYFVTDIDSIDFEGDMVVNPGVMKTEVTNNINSSGYIFIPVNQLRNNMIVIALEPKSELGLVTYKQFEYLLKKGVNYPILRVVN
ncbi:MAG: M14 family zinc carboxypeptidase, partial [Ignavibacteriaceae bacterium]|nr:M14 family zinc carboxypeptidase [Ignavibacteriaceae bacterium]